MATTDESTTAVVEQERRAHQKAEHVALQTAFPVGTRVHLAGDSGELLRDLGDVDEPALYEVTAVTTIPAYQVDPGTTVSAYPVWSLRALGAGVDLPQVVGDRLRRA